MTREEADRRLGLAIAKFEREALLSGKEDPRAGRSFGFLLEKIKLKRIERTIEGAMARCKFVPMVSVQLWSNRKMNRTKIPGTTPDGTYGEFDCIGIENGCLLIGVQFWRKRGVYFHIRTIPLEDIERMYIGYESRERKATPKRTQPHEKLSAMAAPALSERRIAR